MSSVSPIPSNVRKRGKLNLNLREPHPKKKKSLLDEIDIAVAKVAYTAVPSTKKIVEAPTITEVLKYFLYLNQISILNDDEYESMTGKFEQAVEIKLFSSHPADITLFYNKIIIYSASLDIKKVPEKMINYFDLIICQDEGKAAIDEF